MSWDPPPREWFKHNFDIFVQGNKVGTCFAVRNDIVVLISGGNILIDQISVPKAEIRGLWEALIWLIERIFGCRIVLEGDAHDILTVFVLH